MGNSSDAAATDNIFYNHNHLLRDYYVPGRPKVFYMHHLTYLHSRPVEKQESHFTAEKTEAQKLTCMRSGSWQVAEQGVRFIAPSQKPQLSMTICPFWEIDLGQAQMVRSRSREVERAQSKARAPSVKLALGYPCVSVLIAPWPSP